MDEPILPKKLVDILQTIDNMPDAKLSELAKVAELDLAEDYVGADLSGEDISGDSLREANFSDVNFSNTNLSHTDLSIANLSCANLTGAKLINANLNGAELIKTNFTNADLSGADLIGTDFSNANLNDANLTKATLIKACLRYANLTGANLINACLRDADLSDADLKNSDLSNANLVDANLTNADLSNANLTNADLSNANLPEANLSGANLKSSNFNNTNLINANFANANLSNANLAEADLSGANLENTDLSNANLAKADLTGANLKNSNLSNTNLNDTDLTNVVSIRDNLTNNRFKNTNQRKSPIKAFEELLKADRKILSAASELEHSENILDSICKKIQKQFCFDFVSISLVMPEKNTIEAVYGTGIAKKWVGQARHSLEEIEEGERLRDIQADIVKTCQTEIISGWDERFDLGVYNRFGHDNLVRIFTPIFLFYDERKNIIDDWFKSYNWGKNFIQKPQDKPIVFCMEQLPSTPEVIGTLEAGYTNRDQIISKETASSLAQLVAEQALEIRRVSLHYVLETIAESARRFFNANLATLHFLWDSERGTEGKFIYEVFKGSIGSEPLEEFSPRKDGLGWKAIDEKKVKVIYFSQQNKNLNISFCNKAHMRGTKVYAAFPLLINVPEEKLSNSILIGVLYVHFWEESQFTRDLERLGNHFANKAVDAITSIIKYQRVREEVRQLSALHYVTQSFNEIGSDLVSYIAWNTLNALAADVVIIYEFIQAKRTFQIPPNYAGKLLYPKEMTIESPWSLIEGGNDIYDFIFFKDSPFAIREKIKSAAGILLKVNNDLVGVMFINYRRVHNFSGEEKQIINSLASSAATAIDKQRWSQTRGNIELEIVTNQENIKLIVQKAVEITGADVGEITIFDQTGKEVITQESYTIDEQSEDFHIHTKTSKNIIDLLKVYQRPKLIYDVKAEQGYTAYFENTSSELSVSLWDQDKCQRGVLIVGSYQKGKFQQRDLQKLEDIASLALIAVQYAEKDKTIREDIINTVLNLYSKSLTPIKNDVSTTKVVLSISKKLISNSDDENNVEQKSIISDLENMSLNEPNLKQIISDLNENNVGDSKQKGNDSLGLLDEVDKNWKTLAHSVS
ncbi:hypothetical protein FACHB389_32735 [Nostoc calcicola FACHB-389]|nr:pentapeptide repeat-containing protein [Nostoc calcicola FACHB-3891]OKH20473.1 hypothetical protein FACHB389_32735 [Nostoc calcicola FACHB-389]